MKRRVTCGVYIINPVGKLLVLHANEVKADRWGLPKGRHDKGETYLDAAIRETREETGINLLSHIDNIKYVGQEDYRNKDKRLVAFTVTLPVHIPSEIMFCESLYTSLYSGDMVSEVDAWKWVDFETYKHKIQAETVRLWERYKENT